MFIELVSILLRLFTLCFFDPEPCVIWLPDQEWSRHPSALDGEVITPGPQGSPQSCPRTHLVRVLVAPVLPVITAPLVLLLLRLSAGMEAAGMPATSP